MGVVKTAGLESAQSGVTKDDSSLIFRVVGFLEYLTALRYLDPLARKATVEEREAIDQLITEYPEFMVYTNLAARYQSGALNAFAPVNGGDARSGFRWVLALARVELGGILATFSPMPYPFVSVSPTDYEMEAYRNLLMDGARMHYFSLTKDPMLHRAAQSVPGKPMLMYLRRLHVATAFIEAAGGSNAVNLTPLQQSEIASRRQELRELAVLFSDQITSYLAAFQGSREQNSTNLVARDCRNLCDVLGDVDRRRGSQNGVNVFEFDKR
jgi:hypothetical protein